MNILKLLFNNSDLVFLTLGGIVSIASLISAGTKLPQEGTKLYKLHKIIEMLALFVHKIEVPKTESVEADAKQPTKELTKK